MQTYTTHYYRSDGKQHKDYIFSETPTNKEVDKMMQYAMKDLYYEITDVIHVYVGNMHQTDLKLDSSHYLHVV